MAWMAEIAGRSVTIEQDTCKSVCAIRGRSAIAAVIRDGRGGKVSYMCEFGAAGKMCCWCLSGRNWGRTQSGAGTLCLMSYLRALT
jgi:hypothetical protein